MSHVYNTQELILILNEERQACLKGERLNLKAKAGHPLLDQFFNQEGLQKFSAYNQFRAMIHQYQQEHHVSGIIWREIEINNQTLRYPDIDSELIAIPSDLLILYRAKNTILDFWYQIIKGMELYLEINHGKDYRQVTLDQISHIISCTQWANISEFKKGAWLEIVLQLGWGQPQEASYRRGWPSSGSEYIHAVKSGSRPIC